MHKLIFLTHAIFSCFTCQIKYFLFNICLDKNTFQLNSSDKKDSFLIKVVIQIRLKI